MPPKLSSTSGLRRQPRLDKLRHIEPPNWTLTESRQMRRVGVYALRCARGVKKGEGCHTVEVFLKVMRQVRLPLLLLRKLSQLVLSTAKRHVQLQFLKKISLSLS